MRPGETLRTIPSLDDTAEGGAYAPAPLVAPGLRKVPRLVYAYGRRVPGLGFCAPVSMDSSQSMDRIRRMPATVAGMTSAMAIRIAVIAIVVITAVILGIFGRGAERSDSPRTPPGGPTNPYTEQTHHAQYQNCAEATAAGRSNIPRSDPDYQAALDRDADGIACEVGKD
jgi:hypothetical protein